MRKAIRTKGRQRQVSTVQSVPAPIGGWNAKDPLANMSPDEAVELKNWFPTTTDVVIRGGTAAYSTGITGDVETLAVYTAMTGVEQFFAVTDSDLYDISSSGAASDEGLTVTNGAFQYLNMGDGTSNWLCMFNGTDTPKYYNGSAWTEVIATGSPQITGITTTSIVSAVQYHGRLIFLEKDSLSFWYLPAGAVGGLAVEFDLSAYANRGGYLMWAATWTHDSGDGIDDYIVFMTSEGEAIIYTGTDPGTAVLWARLGTYFLGKPLGRRSYIDFGGDLLAITQEGVFNMTDGLKYARVNERVALTDKIRTAFNDAARSYGTSFGWEAVMLPIQNAMLFNIPISSGQEQYVLNTTTGKWCQFTDWLTDCFAVYNDELYFGGSTIVTKAWTGLTEKGSNIVATAKTAFNNFGEISQSKNIMMFRPMLKANGALSYLTDIEVDFEATDITGVATYTPAAGATWDAATWDGGTWQGGLQTIRQWSSPDSGVGYYFAGKLKIEANAVEVHWIANDYVLEQGGILS